MSSNPNNTNLKTPLNPPRDSDMLDVFGRGIALSINCIQVGIIQFFDPVKQTATIKLAMKQLAVQAANGTKVITDYPPLQEVPVVTLCGGPGFISFPIAPGDTCLVLFNDRDIDAWTTGKGVEALPTTSRIHDLSDGFALVGVKPASAPIANFLSDGVRIYFGPNSMIDLKEDGITITGDTVVKGLLSTDYAGDTIVYNTHTHGGVMSGGSNTDEPNVV